MFQLKFEWIKPVCIMVTTVTRHLLSICFCCVLQISGSAGEEKVGINRSTDPWKSRRNLLIFSMKCIMCISLFLDSLLTLVHYAASVVVMGRAPPRRCSIDTDTTVASPHTLIALLWVLHTVCYTYSPYILYTISRFHAIYTLLHWGMKRLCSSC